MLILDKIKGIFKRKEDEEVDVELTKLEEIKEQLEEELAELDPESDRFKTITEQLGKIKTYIREDMKLDHQIEDDKAKNKVRIPWVQLLQIFISAGLSVFFYCGGDFARTFNDLKEAKEEKKKLDMKIDK